MKLPSSPLLCAALGAAALATLSGCGTPPPKSPLPTGQAAIERMRASSSCGYGVQADAKIDFFGKQGRIRGNLLLYAFASAKMRMDAMTQFAATPIVTLTSDGHRFALADLREKRFYVGPASACNIAKFTTVPIPGHVLVGFLRGDAPVLKHDPARSTVEWSSKGYYVVRLFGTDGLHEEEVHVAPSPADFDKPWQDQRVRILDVVVRRQGGVVYHAELEGHAPAAMAKERVDEAGIDDPIPPSGPQCTAEVPRRIHLEVPATGEDVLFRYDQVTWNPPLPEGIFVQPPPPGLPMVPVECKD